MVTEGKMLTHLATNTVANGHRDAVAQFNISWRPRVCYPDIIMIAIFITQGLSAGSGAQALSR